MVTYSVFTIPESSVTVSNGVSLDGITQGSGVQLAGQTLTFASVAATELFVNDAGSESNFADTDTTQTLDGTQTFDGATFTSGTVIEAEYQVLLRDDIGPDATGDEFIAIAVNINNSSPAFGTVEGFAFVGQFPPTGRPLSVVSTSEGPPNSGSSAVNEDTLAPICFVAGTRIQTASGPRPVESLREGDLITTEDGSHRPLLRAFRRRLSAAELRENPKFRPVRIAAGALGRGLPERDLLVSRQHRMVISSPIVAEIFGTSEAMVAAVKLCALPGVEVEHACEALDYYHLLFEQHEVVFAEGAPAESLLAGPEALRSVSEETREEILALMPDAAETAMSLAARSIPSGAKQKALVAAHAASQTPVL